MLKIVWATRGKKSKQVLCWRTFQGRNYVLCSVVLQRGQGVPRLPSAFIRLSNTLSGCKGGTTGRCFSFN